MDVQSGEDAVELQLSTRSSEGCAIVEVEGEVDISTEPHLREYLVKVIEAGASVVIVDLSGVEFLDSTGLGMFVATYKRLQEVAGRLCLAAPQQQVRKLLNMTALDRVIKVYDTVEAATATAADR